MRRFCLTLFVLAVVVVPARAGRTGTDRKLSIRYLQELQTDAGGFLSAAIKPNVRMTPTLRATTSAVRALHYFGGEAKDPKAAAGFVARCFDPATGGFADTPGGKADVFATAVGLMAVVELNMPKDKYVPAGTKFLATHARSFDDIRIAVAGFEAVKAANPAAEQWIAQVRGMQNPDGTITHGKGQARATGSAAVALLRLGTKLEHPDAVLKALKAGQRGDGGFGKADADTSDLETTYRVMRCFHMMKATPDRVDALLTFVERCRDNTTGGYGVAPGQAPNVSGTYYAAIVQRWLRKDPPPKR
jgi:hypothetical protein